MARFAVTLSILFSTWAVLGAADCQNQAELEGSCETRSNGRVALQIGKTQPVESVVEEVVPAIGIGHREKNTKTGDSLTQSGRRWWSRRRPSASTPTPAPKSRMRSFMSWMVEKFTMSVLTDIKAFDKKIGKEWKDLPHDVKSKIIEFCPREEALKQALGDEFWNKLSGYAKHVFEQCQFASLLQVSKQRATAPSTALAPGPLKLLTDFFGTDLFGDIDWVVSAYDIFIGGPLGAVFEKLPVEAQAVIVLYACSDERLESVIERIKAIVGVQDMDSIVEELVKTIAAKQCKNVSKLRLASHVFKAWMKRYLRWSRQ